MACTVGIGIWDSKLIAEIAVGHSALMAQSLTLKCSAFCFGSMSICQTLTWTIEVVAGPGLRVGVQVVGLARVGIGAGSGAVAHAGIAGGGTSSPSLPLQPVC